MGSLAALLCFSSIVTAGGSDPGGVSAWIHDRGREYEQYLRTRARPAREEKLWRERSVGEPIPGFTPPTSVAPLVRAVRSGVVNVSTQNAPQGSARSLGSGFIISGDGYVVTNHHVIERARQVEVKLADGRQFAAEIVGEDPSTDLALLHIQGATGELPSVYLGDSDRLEVGDWVIAIGNPFGLDHSVAQGIISAKERVIGVGDFDDFLQTDALINPGNSGGPLFDMRGEVVGVNTAVVSQGQGIGFAVPINMVKDLLPNLRVNGHLARGWLGVNITEEKLSSEGTRSAVIKDVYVDSPAAQAGLRAGDRVVSVNGKPIVGYLQLLRRVALLPPGAAVKLGYVREGQLHDATATLGERPAPDTLQVAPGYSGPLGIIPRDITPALSQTLGLPVTSGVLVAAVVPGSVAELAGLRAGDAITEVNRKRVTDVHGFRGAIDRGDAHEPVLLKITRGDESRYVAVGP